jgi:glyoxylase-like metal-dependent hydrolase (beta-lactamase superfamily II)
MTEIIPNIYRLQLPLPNNPLGYVNTYLVQGDNGCLLIDTGWNNEPTLSSLKTQLAEIGANLENISQIVATHIHPDHYGLASRLKQLSGAKIALHYLERDLIESYNDIDKLIQQGVQMALTNGMPADMLSQLLTQMRATQPEMMEFAPLVLPDVTLRGGEATSVGSFTFKVLWTPGHSPGHICLHEPNKEILISGDHILPDTNTDVGLEPNFSPNPLDDYLNSLNEIKQFKVNLVLPGHGHPFTGLQQRIEELIRNHKQRSSEIMETVKLEAKTAYQISSELTWMTNMNQVSWQDLPPWAARLALLKTLAHLESMSFGGKVDKFFKDSIIYYQAT